MHPRRRCRGSSKGLSTTPGGDEGKLELVGKHKQPTKTTLDSSVFTSVHSYVCVSLFGVTKHQLSCLSMLLAEFLGRFFCKKPAPNKTRLYIYIFLGMYRKSKQLVGVCRGVKLIRDTPSVRNPGSPGIIVSPCFVIHMREASL